MALSLQPIMYNSILLLPCLMIDVILYIVSFFLLLFFWCPCMAINVVSVQYNGGLFPDSTVDSMLLPHRGTRLNVMKRFCICSL